MAESLRVKDLASIVAAGLCMGCGFCTITLEQNRRHPAVQIRYDSQVDAFAPFVVDGDTESLEQEVLCPGASMDLVSLSNYRFGEIPQDHIAGRVIASRVCHATDPALRNAAASGGAIPALLAQLLDDGAIDALYVVDAGDHVYDAHGKLLTELTSFERCHGSVYHPVDFGRQLRGLVDSTARFAFIGLPCEIAALEMLKQRRPDVAARHVISIGLFCGGVNSFQGIAYYLQGFGIAWSSVDAIRYRIGAWPGKIEITDRQGTKRRLPRIQGNSRWQILRYVVAFQGYWMLPRCRMCPDQIADLADIAVGDPHLPRYKEKRSAGHSIVITRTATGESLVKRLVQNGNLVQSPLTRDELIASQGYTLDNRRHVVAYLRVAKALGRKLPDLGLYSSLAHTARMRHYIYAWVDLLKLSVAKHRWLRSLYVPLQAVEYLFITFTPMLIARRLLKLLRNR